MPTITKYGSEWDTKKYDPLQIELWSIRLGGKWKNKRGQDCGLGLYQHYKNAMTLLWPEDDWHRWAELGLRAIVENTVTVFVGPGDSNKTYTLSKFALLDYWVEPQKTLFLISSTDARGLELRIWGKIKELFNRALDRYEYLPGKVLEAARSITPQDIDPENRRGRQLNRGLMCVPCMSGNTYVGLSKYIGVKADRFRHIGDEVQFMGESFLTAYDNWYGKDDFKGMMAGNPYEPTDPLGKAAEPEEGWTAMPTPTKTTTWRSRFYNAMVVNFVGTDSPNFDFPKDKPPKYHYLVSWKKIDAVNKTYGPNSPNYYRQCVGVMVPGLISDRVITRELCRNHHAFDQATWITTQRTHIYACDPAYGGGDRCVGLHIEFGDGLDGKQIIKFYEHEIIPIDLRRKIEPEDQIAEYIKMRLEELDIPVENCFYDSFGKGTLGFAFAKQFGAVCPIPVDSGAMPTDRPVRFDLYVGEGNERRLKTCREHYSKFVTEMWFSVHESVKGEQIRELPQDIMEEGCLRIYKTVRGDKIEVEPKDDLKERTGRSPDLFDTAAIAIEGARQRGFKIMRIGTTEEEKTGNDWYEIEADQYRNTLTSKLLAH